MEVIGQLHDLATLALVKELPLPFEEEAVWAPELFWVLWRREKWLALPKMEHEFLGHQAHSQLLN
jgi:hypothetical protein